MAEATYSQKASSSDTVTAGAFVFDTISSKDYAVTKVAFGAEGSVSYVSSGSPLPVTAASLPLPSGAATESTLSTLNGKVTACNTGAVVVSSSALPSGAATAAKQPALGTAGTASSDVITVQGIASMTALKVDGSAVTQPVSGTFWQATQPVSIASAVPITDNSGSLTIDAPVGTPAFVRLSDGTSAITTLPVSLASVPSHAVTNAGIFAVQVDGTALTRLTDIETNTDSCAVVGNGAAATAQRVTIANDSTGVIATVTSLTGGGVAHDGADSGNPHKIGAKATTALSGLTLVADADRTDLRAGVDGVLINRPHTGLEDIVTGNASNTDGSSTQCIAASGAGVKTYLQTIILTNTSSSNTYCEIKDGTTVKLTIPVPANGGAVVNLPVPLGGTANTAWNFDPGAATTTMYCSMIGWKSKV